MTGAVAGTVIVDVVFGCPVTLKLNTILPATVPVCNAGIAALDAPAAIVKETLVAGELPQGDDEKHTPGFV